MHSNSYQWYSNSNHWNRVQNPYQQQSHNLQTQQLKQHTLSTVEPIVQYGLKEAQVTSYLHAMREASAISYLIGRGYDPQTAHQIVESWEVNEMFYP
ncbi:hypothetical protein [Metabacillus fastidiosus]|uniref:hypothetical protein n=1 Tax=Metabacillus fastidiosus TaxID=1458 RepID=UPI003D27F713